MIDPTLPRALTDDAIITLSNQIDRLDSPQEFFEECDRVLSLPKHSLKLPVDPGTPPSLQWMKNGPEGQEAENAKSIYNYLGAMDLANAADPRLWSQLALGPFREYMKVRWPLNDDGNWRGRIRERYLMTNSTRRSLVKHGIARLWWITELTYDADLSWPLSRRTDDHFAHTSAAMCNEDRIQSIFERELGSSRHLAMCVLEQLEALGPEKRGAMAKKLTKELTVITGFREFTNLNVEQVRSALQEIIDSWELPAVS